MSVGSNAPYSFLYGTQRAELVPVLERALEGAGIPYHSGLLADPEPHVVFTVPDDRLDEARRLLARHVRSIPEISVENEDEVIDEEIWERAREEEARERRAATFPRGPLQAGAALVLAHFAILFAFIGTDPTASRLASLGGLVRADAPIEPWRLVTSLFLHSGVRHVAWNGLSFVVFLVPAIVAWGYGRTALLYLLAGIGGGIAGFLAHPAGTVLVGSSGAVAGLFGAWLVATLRRALRAPMTRHAIVRAVGIGLLVLPSLLTPTTSDGRSISVAAHLGGMATGAAIGYVLDVLRDRRR